MIKNCMCCGKDIKLIHGDISKPEDACWLNGSVNKFTIGYGSKFDGDVYIIALCDDCIDKNLDRLEFDHNYLKEL